MSNKLEDLSESKIFRELSMRLFKVQWRERMVVILMYLSTWPVSRSFCKSALVNPKFDVAC